MENGIFHKTFLILRILFFSALGRKMWRAKYKYNSGVDWRVNI